MKGAITARLRALGWNYVVTADGECGAVGENTGYCERIAKWERSNIAGTLCAAHALSASQSRRET